MIGRDFEVRSVFTNKPCEGTAVGGNLRSELCLGAYLVRRPAESSGRHSGSPNLGRLVKFRVFFEVSPLSRPQVQISSDLIVPEEQASVSKRACEESSLEYDVGHLYPGSAE